MTSFGWKRKRSLATSSAAAFGGDRGSGDKEEDDEGVESEGVDWLTAAKKRRLILLEDNKAKSKRLQEEGAILAENGRYWEAIKYWSEALQLTPQSTVLHEMKSQALMEVGEVFEAVQSAEKAVELSPTWATARQTLGRAQLGIGEVYMALRNFEKAVHLNPSDQDMWTEDLKWAWDLAQEKTKQEQEKDKEESEQCY